MTELVRRHDTGPAPTDTLGETSTENVLREAYASLDRYTEALDTTTLSTELHHQFRDKLETAVARLDLSFGDDATPYLLETGDDPSVYQYQLVGLIVRGYELLGEDSPLATDILRSAITQEEKSYRYFYLRKALEDPAIHTFEIRQRAFLHFETEAIDSETDQQEESAPPDFHDGNTQAPLMKRIANNIGRLAARS